jgi:hypothetical protein
MADSQVHIMVVVKPSIVIKPNRRFILCQFHSEPFRDESYHRLLPHPKLSHVGRISFRNGRPISLVAHLMVVDVSVGFDFRNAAIGMPCLEDIHTVRSKAKGCGPSNRAIPL